MNNDKLLVWLFTCAEVRVVELCGKPDGLVGLCMLGCMVKGEEPFVAYSVVCRLVHDELSG